ncbi:hypothetical protein RSAG8_13657, partial [Rhizoctonia solani AG-8 WAC10335]
MSNPHLFDFPTIHERRYITLSSM